MAKKSAKARSQTNGLKKNVENYEHQGAKRLNNPPVGLVNTKTEKAEQKKTYKFDPHLSPQLQWAGKEERSEIELPTVSIHVHERIDPKTIIEAVRSSDGLNWEQLNLFNRPINKLSFIKEIQFYQHQKDWTNRIIAGDSLLVMNSLLEKEGMENKIQMVYFDPPYGIKYGSNFQPFVSKRDVVDGKDDDLNTEPETIKAFRDTWELGIHSYLTYMRDRINLIRELLAPSGCVFVQISDENQHYLRIILDEIFGPKNFVSQITFQKTTGSTTDTLQRTSDYLLLYAKDIERFKFRKLYEPQIAGQPGAIEYRRVELPDGTIHPISKFEQDGKVVLPSGARVFTTSDISSKGGDDPDIKVSYDGKTFTLSCKPNRHWKPGAEGIVQLWNKNRLLRQAGLRIYKRYLDDFPYREITHVWNDTRGETEPSYVVQTSTKVIERCIQLTTDPGDIVFDPTCGSGTTAFAAEKWGRRWITCDTSRVATTLTRERLMTASFDYYQLENPEEGIGSGLFYKRAPRITLGSIAKSEPPEEVVLYDQPVVDPKKVRITGPFTVEAVPAPIVKALESESVASNVHDPVSWIEELKKSGIRLPKKQILKIARLELASGTKWIHADGETAEDPAQRIVVSFGPDFAPLEQRQVELALQEAEKLKPSPTVVVFAAFQFDPEAAKDIDEIEWGGVSVLKVQMNSDLFTDDLKKKKSSNESFWLVGQPDIESEKVKLGEDKGKIRVKVNGFDYYNTKTGTIESGGANKIAMWLLDTDYDGRSMLPRQVFFPMSGKDDGWSKLAKCLKAEIDQELIEKYRGTISLPFEIGENKRIAIKIIDDRGVESLTIRELD